MRLVPKIFTLKKLKPAVLFLCCPTWWSKKVLKTNSKLPSKDNNNNNDKNNNIKYDNDRGGVNDITRY